MHNVDRSRGACVKDINISLLNSSCKIVNLRRFPQLYQPVLVEQYPGGLETPTIRVNPAEIHAEISNKIKEIHNNINNTNKHQQQKGKGKSGGNKRK